jgi:TonB family protein
MIRFIMVIAIILSASSGVIADYWNGFNAYQKKDYATALREWLPMAEKGHVDAQYRLGVMYNEGQGVAVDKAAAMEWFHKAARGAHAKAQLMLAIGYLEGIGLPEDEKKGLKWLRRAAKGGSSEAQLQLALMYETGDRLPAEPDEAFGWYEKAAMHGSRDAQMLLARSYLEGHGRPRDSVKAFKWAVHAAATGNEQAHALARSIVDQTLQERATVLFQQSRAFYRQGRYDLAAAAWRYLAHRGVVEAQVALARAYSSGHGVPLNPSEACRWRTIAEEQGAAWLNDDWTLEEIAPFPRAGEQSGISPPVLIPGSKVEPDYPEQARIERKDGMVILLAVIRKDGTVTDISISRSSMPSAAFEEAGKAAFSQWRYEPATKDGEPVEVMFEVLITWSLM